MQQFYRVIAKTSAMRTLFIAIAYLFAIPAYCQTVISGKVIDEHQQAVPGANVMITGTYDGASTDANGEFQFFSTEQGRHILIIRFVGFKEFSQEIELTGKPVTIKAVLKEAINELEVVTITAGSFSASDEKRRTIFKAIDIATTAGATADIAGALNTLPGTQKVGEEGRLFVRGGDGNETRTFIDGLVVMDAYSPTAPNTPSRGRFLPFMFKGTSFSTGGYSAEYGQALSSALVLDTRDEAVVNRTDIGLLSVGADVTQTHAWNTGSIAGKIQYTDIRPYFNLINQYLDWITPPVAVEANTAFRQQFTNNGMLKVYGNVNNSAFSLYEYDIADASIKYPYHLENTYGYVNAFYSQPLSKIWSVRGGASYTYTHTDTKVDSLRIHERDAGIHGKLVFDGSVSDQVELRTGVELYNHDHVHTIQSVSPVGFEEIIGATFVEADIYASNRFVTRAGVRGEYHSLLGQAAVDPRVSLALKTGKNGQVSLAYGTFRQSPKSQFLRLENTLQQERAQHYILNYQRIDKNRTFRVETYYKKYADLIKFSLFSQPTNNGYGYARGLELFWRDNRTFKNVDYWVSYSFLDTERNYLNTPYAVTPSFASTHNFSVVYKHFISKIKSQLGLTYSYTSPRAYNDPNQEVFNGSMTPFYQDLSANISYLPRPFLIFHLSCTNLLGRDNIFGYQYSVAPDTEGVYAGRPLRQPAKRFLFLGIFITLSKDKSINQLPTL
jgi:hypothetical protein